VLDPAERIAQETRAKVYLLCLFPPVHDVGQSGVSPDTGTPDAHIREVEATTQAAEASDSETMAYLLPIAERFADFDPEPIAHESAHSAEDILAVAARLHVDLIAMATHGRTGLAHIVLGSVAEAVVRSSAIPVLLVRPRR
jgi:nucleotide-binding universal stress UspA family protein